MAWDRCCLTACSICADFVVHEFCAIRVYFSRFSLSIAFSLDFVCGPAPRKEGVEEILRVAARLRLLDAGRRRLVLAQIDAVHQCPASYNEGSNTVELLLCRRPQLQAHAPAAAANQLLHFSRPDPSLPHLHIFTSSSHLRGSLKSRIESSPIYTLHFIL